LYHSILKRVTILYLFSLDLLSFIFKLRMYSCSTVHLSHSGTITSFVARGSAVCAKEVLAVKDRLQVGDRKLHGFWPFTR
jgi:hypothetical protein